MPGLGRLARRLALHIRPALCPANPKALGLLEYASSWAGAYLLRRGLFLPHELTQVMDPDVAREGLRRLKPLGVCRRLLSPDPGTDVARVAVLEFDALHAQPASARRRLGGHGPWRRNPRAAGRYDAA